MYPHLTDNPDHKIDFDETEVMAQIRGVFRGELGHGPPFGSPGWYN